MKSYLFILRKPAHAGLYTQEMLDVILTTAAFEQPVSLLLLDDGVFQLKQGQQPECLGLKDTSAIFNALAGLDVHNIYVEQESLQERGLSAKDLTLPVTLRARKDINLLMQSFDLVFAG